MPNIDGMSLKSCSLSPIFVIDAMLYTPYCRHNPLTIYKPFFEYIQKTFQSNGQCKIEIQSINHER
jgi:hypothetical protein